MSDILFLDDCPIRTKRIKEKIPSVICTETAQGMIALLKEAQEPVQYLFLDHDLGGAEYADSSREDTGFEVVRWIVANKPKIDWIYVHTHNSVAGPNMERALLDAGYVVQRVPFYTLIGLINKGE